MDGQDLSITAITLASATEIAGGSALKEGFSRSRCAGGLKIHFCAVLAVNMLMKKACRAQPLVYLVLATAVTASVPRMLTNHCTGHEHSKQTSKQAKDESGCAHTQKLQNPAIHIRHCLLFLS